MKADQKTALTLLKEKAPTQGTDIAALCKSWCKRRNIPESEVFTEIGQYFANFQSVDGSITDMVRIWFLCTTPGLLTETEMDELHEWFFN